MSNFTENHKLLADGLAAESEVIATSREFAALSAIPQKLDQRIAFLDREADSANTRQARADARQLAVDEIGAVRKSIAEKWSNPLDAAREKMLEPIEASDRLRVNAIWSQIPANLDPNSVDAIWPELDDEVQIALLSAPPRLVSDGNGGLSVQEVVSPDRRANEMERRRPDAAAQVAGLEQAEHALTTLANVLERAILGNG